MIQQNMTFEEYRALPGCNWSSLKHYSKTPAHYMENMENPMEQSPAMLLGSALHAIALEGPVAFSHRYACAPECDRRTKAGKELWSQFLADNANKEVLSAEQGKLLAMMWQAISIHPTATNLLNLCRQREASITWNDLETGIPCKCRLDGFNSEYGIIIDLKTSDDASPTAFARTCAKFGYHGQSAFYLDGLQAAGVPANQFIFIVVEKTPPFAIAVYVADDDMIQAGRLKYQEYLRRHAECLAGDDWPGYPVEVQPITLPPWA